MGNELVNPSKYLGNEYEYIGRVLQAESWSATAGSWNRVLEQAFAERIGVRYAVAMNSGTSTLHAALEAAGVGYGDEVISPALTVMMNTTSTLHANAIPVYADVRPDTFTIDPEDVARKITPRTRAIQVVSLYGLPPDLDPIMELAVAHGLVVIEDNAQCLFSMYNGRATGTIGHLASYSFENTKHLSCGEGGMIVTDSEAYAEAARKIGGHGFKNLRAEEGRVRLRADEFQRPDYKRHDVLGWNYRMPEFNAAIVLAQLERADQLVDLRVQSARMFIEVMQETDYLVPQITPPDRTNSYYTLGVRYRGAESIGVSWLDFRRAYVEAGGDGIYGAWSVPYLEPMMTGGQFKRRCPDIYGPLSYDCGLCPVAESIQPELMQFKTNYRDLDLAASKAEILQKVIRRFAN